MPKTTRWFLKSSLIYLVIALLLNFLISIKPYTNWSIVIPSPIFFHLFLVGWVTNLIIGVVNWMFPKKSRDQPRGNEIITWLVFSLLNAGLVIRVFVEPIISGMPSKLLDYLLIFSAMSQWIAALFFVGNVWSRVKER